MRKVYVPLIAITGFLMIWLGLSPEAENWSGPISDTLSLSHAQAERVEEKSEKSENKDEPNKDEHKKDPEAHTADSKPTEGAGKVSSMPACLPSQALADLNQRKKSLEEREVALQSREQELTVREKALEERMKSLQAYREEASKVDAKKKKEFEEKIARTVELLESMAPKAASQLIATTDERLAVEAMSRMSTSKLSKIMNIMEPKRSVRLMELLSGNGTPVAAESSKVVPESGPKKEEKL